LTKPGHLNDGLHQENVKRTTEQLKPNGNQKQAHSTKQHNQLHQEQLIRQRGCMEPETKIFDKPGHLITPTALDKT
jgi:hypothetical protein